MSSDTFNLPPKLATQEAITRHLWQKDPRRTYLSAPNLRLQNYLFVLSFVTIVTLMVYWYFMPFFITEKMLLERLVDRDFGGLEKKVDSTYQLAAEVQKLVKVNEHFTNLAADLQNSTVGSLAKLSKMESSLGEYQNLKKAMEGEVLGLRDKIKQMEEEQGASMPKLQAKMIALKSLSKVTAGAFYAAAEAVENPPETKEEWQQSLTSLQGVVTSLKESAAAQEDEVGKRLFEEVGTTLARVAGVQRARQLRTAYIDNINTQIMGPKLSEQLKIYRKDFERAMTPVMAAEVLAATAQGTTNDLDFADGNAERDSPAVAGNYSTMKKAIEKLKEEPDRLFMQKLAMGASINSSEKGSEINDDYVKAKLTKFDELQKLYINPISALIAQDKLDDGHQIFMKSLHAALEDQQPYIMWGMLKYGNRLLRDATIQPTALGNLKLWNKEFELENPFIFKRNFAEFQLYDYKRHVCSIYPNVRLYPSLVNAFSCVAEKAGKMSKRKATFELEPGTYFIHQAETSEDQLQISFKGNYAIQTISLFVRGAPFGFYIDIPFEEDEGYWVTPIRGIIHTFDKEKNEPSQLPIQPNSLQAESWAKYNILQGGTSDWSKEHVMANKKFLESMGEK